MPLEYDPIARGIIEPLALVDWFTSFQALDQTTGMYIVSHSTRQHRRYTSVICVTDILRTVHLIPYAVSILTAPGHLPTYLTGVPAS